MRFDVPANAAGRQAWLLFGAIDEAATGWLYGKYAFRRPFPCKGDRNSWKKPFVIDVPRFLQPDQTNVLSVAVTDTAGEGGIWKPVTLLLGPKK